MLERVRLTQIAPAPAFGGWTGTEANGLRIGERSGLAIIEVASFRRGESGRHTLSRAFGIVLPGPGSSSEAAGIQALSIGPGRWLVMGSEAAVGSLPAPPDDEAAITDLSGGRAVLTLAGANAVRTLRKGTAVDLDPCAFAAGAVAATALARMPVVIWRSGDMYEVIVPRSYAVSLLDWLIVAGAA
jgi:heterotetrameric sarcosine oxidase gamma subunit